MDHMELVTRVGDLEGILEVLVRENDAIVEELKSQVSDLSQQVWYKLFVQCWNLSEVDCL